MGKVKKWGRTGSNGVVEGHSVADFSGVGCGVAVAIGLGWGCHGGGEEGEEGVVGELHFDVWIRIWVFLVLICGFVMVDDLLVAAFVIY